MVGESSATCAQVNGKYNVERSICPGMKLSTLECPNFHSIHNMGFVVKA
jgi:hypothetical protein